MHDDPRSCAETGGCPGHPCLCIGVPCSQEATRADQLCDFCRDSGGKAPEGEGR